MWVTGRRTRRPRRRDQYGYSHQRERKAWAPRVQAGGVACSVCGYGIVPGTPWHLDHVIPVSLGGAQGPKHPAHARCNISKGGANRLSA